MRRLLFCVAAAAAVFAPMSGSASGAAERTLASAALSAEAERVTPGPGLPVWLKGEELGFNPPAATVNGTLFVPATRLAGALGVKEEYVGDSYAPTVLRASAGGTTLTFRAGSASMERNGREVPLPSAPYIDDDFLYVPLRAFAEAFGYIVRWDELKHAVVVENEWGALPAVGTSEKLQALLGASALGGFGGFAKDTMTVTMTDQTAAAPAASPSSAASGEAAKSKSESSDYSGTNVQVAGVDEGDLVKTDGTHLYQVSGRKIVISRVAPAAEMKVEAELPLDARFTPRELYADGDRLVVIGRSSRMTAAPTPDASPETMPAPNTSVQAEPAAPAAGIAASKIRLLPYGMSSTKAIVYDVSDRSRPKQLRTVELDGAAVATRKIGSVLYLVSNSPSYSYSKEKDGAADGPSYRDSLKGEAPTAIGLPDVRYFPGTVRPNYLLVGGLDLDRPEEPFSVSAFLGAGQEVYMSQKSLYVATMQYNQAPGPVPLPRPQSSAGDAASIAVEKARVYEPSTTVYRFTLDDGRVRYAAKGDVPGTVLNQFSMDEYDDTFRIATTKPDGNALYTLDPSMQTIGRLEKLAPGERIYSARFIGSRAYLVTFKQVDPLFVIDAADPKQPTLLGALKIPGYSDYLHPYDETHLIGFGKETSQDGKGAVLTQGMKVSLFDVSDVAHPVELFKTNIGDRGTESDLLRDHKALLFSRDKGLLAFPVTVREVANGTGKEGPFAYGAFTFQGAYVYKLDLSSGFRLQGRITHLNEQNSLKAGYDSYDPAYGVKRILYVGNTLYTVSDGAVQANALDSLKEEGRLELGGN